MDFSWMDEVLDSLEKHREFRVRCLEGRNLTVGMLLSTVPPKSVVRGSLDCCKLNVRLIKAFLTPMAKSTCIFNPPIFLVQGAMLEFHGRNGYPNPDGLLAVASEDAKGIKRMLSFLRRKFSREEMPRATRLLE